MTGHLEESDLAADLQEAGIKILFKPFSLAAFYREARSGFDANRASKPAPQLVNATRGEDD